MTVSGRAGGRLPQVRRIPIPALRPLRPLVGTWKTRIRWSEETHKLARGPREFTSTTTFRWYAGGQFLVGTLRIGFPTRWIIAGDDSSSDFTVITSDSRGVARVFSMSMAHGAWEMARNAPGFYQRFEARLEGSSRMSGHFDRSMDDGKTWIRDADVEFSRVGPARRALRAR
jgi:hypothetical protein